MLSTLVRAHVAFCVCIAEVYKILATQVHTVVLGVACS